MTNFAILINKNTGIPIKEIGYTGDDILTEDLIPPNVEQIIVNDTNPNFELIKAFFFGDPNRLTTEYKLVRDGGIKYDFTSKSFTFHKDDISIDIEQVRNVRNDMLKQTDQYMLVPDLPQDIKTQLITLRSTLRNITSKVGTEWQTVYDIQWPTFPEKLIVTQLTPPMV
jgi:hypothetical protein